MTSVTPSRELHNSSTIKRSWALWLRNLLFDPGLLIALALCLLLPTLHQPGLPAVRYLAEQSDFHIRLLNASPSASTSKSRVSLASALANSSLAFDAKRGSDDLSVASDPYAENIRRFDDLLLLADEGLQWDEREEEEEHDPLEPKEWSNTQRMEDIQSGGSQGIKKAGGADWLSHNNGTTTDELPAEERAGRVTAVASGGQQRTGGQELEVTPVGRLKIFVYDLPARYNRNFIKKEPRCLTHMFALEVLFHQYMLTSPVRTTNPEEADWFYMPVYLTCDLTPSGLPLPFRSPRMLRAAIALVSMRWPYWNRTEGADHFFITPHDFGACFHYEEEKAIGRGIMPLLSRATLVQTFGQRNHVCHRKGSIVVPPYAPLTNMHRRLIPPDTPRSIFVYFRGLFYDSNNDPKGGYYARGARASIWENFKDNPLFDISPAHPASYYEDMQRSLFCLCPLGWAPWSPRLVESVFFGCIPVIIADDIVLPFSDVIPWREIAVFVAEEDVPKLDTLLSDIGPQKILDMQRRLSHPAIRRAVVLAHPPQEGDVFHQVLNGLARKLPHPPSAYLSPDEPRMLNWSAGPTNDLKPWRPNSPVFW